jgi:hypothetical protein
MKKPLTRPTSVARGLRLPSPLVETLKRRAVEHSRSLNGQMAAELQESLAFGIAPVPTAPRRTGETVSVGIRLPIALDRSLHDAAANNNRSLNQEIYVRLARTVMPTRSWFDAPIPADEFQRSDDIELIWRHISTGKKKTLASTAPADHASESIMPSDNRSSAQLIEDALSWPEIGPGAAVWDSWILRARVVRYAGAAHQVLADLVDQERSDGLSTGRWEAFLDEAMLLRIVARSES